MGIFTLKTFVACTTDILKTYDDYFNNPPTLIFDFETDFYESAKSAPNTGGPGGVLAHLPSTFYTRCARAEMFLSLVGMVILITFLESIMFMLFWM